MLTINRGRGKAGQITQTKVFLCSGQQDKKETPACQTVKSGNRGEDQYQLLPGGIYKAVTTVRKRNGIFYKNATFFSIDQTGQGIKISL